MECRQLNMITISNKCILYEKMLKEKMREAQEIRKSIARKFLCVGPWNCYHMHVLFLMIEFKSIIQCVKSNFIFILP